MSKAEKNHKVVRKKTKKIKNPNAPKPPINAYFFFLIEQRLEFKVKYPNLKPQELVKKVYEKWLQLDITEKEKNPDKLISNNKINHNLNNISQNLNIESENQNFDSSVRDTINQKETEKDAKLQQVQIITEIKLNAY